ncbi:MAG: hypothetical protein QF357_11795, partial [Dehalococcoidia bacterium]|nr:hypothetical protein [Dehalococcoidia bacterium]
WQWPDGGWNCDGNPDANTSSFNESLLPLRALGLYERSHPGPELHDAVDRAAEVFLTRKLFRRRSTGAIVRQDFTRLHYPLYWHYDILGALKVMVEIGRIGDPRCAPALDLLESKQLPDCGWPAEAMYYTWRKKTGSGSDFVYWGGTSKVRMNEWVTADALGVLAAAGR